MQWTRTDGVRRRIVVAGLIIGPVLVALSVAINLTPPGDSMRAEFDTMTANPGLIAAEALLETIGFMIALAAFAGSAQALRTRGGALGTWGAALSIVGIVGFALSNTTGFELATLAQLPDHDSAFETARSITSGGMADTIGTIGMFMEIAGQVGILLVIIGLIRARITKIWPLLFGIVGMILNAAIGLMVTTLIADLLLVAAGTWIAVRIARSTRAAWLGESAVVAAPHETQLVSPR